MSGTFPQELRALSTIEKKELEEDENIHYNTNSVKTTGTGTIFRNIIQFTSRDIRGINTFSGSGFVIVSSAPSGMAGMGPRKEGISGGEP